MSDVKLQRTITRFQAKIDSGSFYEAHQTLRTIANRYIHQKEYLQAIDLLYQGALILAKNNEFASSSDLISYILQCFNEGEIASTDKAQKLKLIELLSYLPNDETTLIGLAKDSIEWSVTETNKFGDNDLHHFFGVKFLHLLQEAVAAGSVSKEESEKLFAFAELHLILGTFDSVPVYVDYLFEWYKSAILEDPDVDAGLFLSRAVINYGYLHNIKFIGESIELFTKKLGEEDTSLLKFSLINFSKLLYLTLQTTKDNSGKFLKLYGQYKKVLTEHELLTPVEYLGKEFFNVSLGSPNNQQNVLANLMGGLFK